MPPLDRDQFIALLKRLSSTNDAEVLEAAHALQARMEEAGVGWEALLAPSDGDVPGDDAGQRPEAEADAEVARALPAGPAVAEDLALIDKLMRDKNLSPDTRDILEDLRADFSQSEATEADRRYIRALAERIGRRN